ncbi:efflux RND transporter periplasmic adaptor subunit [Paenibacillus sp. GD4]|uniref:efflux RND transporter periplasmic adaptor subunit n=1 Tax=Paenibacillus sp. GD4 TaxID=3068890 RepID=UPI0027966709|nr:efflux RND transporter periplasmic adaptor subunit [Paenibacillus sp. GD4]MDQ1909807.1 efflux RND transporter periplasmic adaptor subunit [Paenibacillus sp. GD4]
MKKKTWITSLAVITVVGVTATLYIQSHPSSPPPQSSLQTANALRFQAEREDIVSTVEVKGKSSYQKETYVNAPFTADVKSWSVTDGAQVKKGDVLFRLDDSLMQSEIAQLHAGNKKQEMDLRLAEFQDSTGGTSTAAAASVGETEAKQRFAQAETRRMQEDISRLTLEHNYKQLSQKTEKLKSAEFLAPEEGIFLFNDTKEPQSVKENERIGKIVDITKLQLLCMVGEYDLFRLKVGMPVQVKVEALKGVKLQGKVERLSKFAKTASDSDAANAAAAQFEVVISLEPHEQLIAGLSLTATIETDRKQGTLVIPTLAIQRDKEQYYVMVEGTQGLEKRILQIGLETPDKTEVLSGLQEGETVVLQ